MFDHESSKPALRFTPWQRLAGLAVSLLFAPEASGQIVGPWRIKRADWTIRAQVDNPEKLPAPSGTSNKDPLPNPCTGTNGIAPSLDAKQVTPDTLTFRIAAAPAMTPTFLLLRSLGQAAPSPLLYDLTSLGAHDCQVAATHDLLLSAFANRDGRSEFIVPLPAPTEFPIAFLVQGVVLDPNANGIGLTTTGAIIVTATPVANTS